MFYIFGECTLDTQRHELHRSEVLVKLERKVYQVLLHLLQHSDRLVTKEELLEAVWPGVYVEDTAVARCIRAVRQAVGDDRAGQSVIKTIHAQGYRFVAPVVTRTETPANLQPLPVEVPPPSPSAPPVTSTVSPGAVPSPTGAERRLVTVLCGSVSATPPLVSVLDLEDQYAVATALATLVHEAVQPYSGTVHRLTSDRFTVVFGTPQAQEEHARRAALAALVLQQQWPTALAALMLPTTVSLTVQMGLHTGPAVVETAGRDQPGALMVVGEVAPLAAHLTQDAPPNVIVLSGVTYQLVRDYFECQDLGIRRFPDHASTVEVYRLLHPYETQNRFDISLRRGLTPLAGRQEDLTALWQRWQQAQEGVGQVVILHGEAGIGKSRLVQELRERVNLGDASTITFQCSPYHQHSALYPVTEHLQRLLQFRPDDDPQVKLDKLQTALAQYRFPQPDTVPLLASLLSLPHPAGVPPLALSPQKQKEKTLAALVAWLSEEAERQALYCIWEDLHWADPSTLELLTLFLDQVPQARLLAVLTARPEFTPPWAARSFVHALSLGRLAPQHAEEMVVKVLGDTNVSPEVVQQIVTQTDGVPLFIEELTKSVIESVGSIESVESIGSEGKLGQSFLQLGIPATVQDSLMARLDRLGPAKEIAQMGAVIGRDFSHAVLQALSARDEDRLQQGLRQLVEAELLYQRGMPPHAHYSFKHALVQETAYASLLKSTRHRLHGQVAQVLESPQFAKTVETHPELVAHHYAEAGLITQSVPYWLQAGQRATQRSANREAIRHLTHGLELLRTLPDDPARIQQELTLRTALGLPLMMTKGYAADDVEANFVRARELCQHVGETPYLFAPLWGLWAFYVTRGESKETLPVARQILSLAEHTQNPVFRLHAHYALGASFFWRAELVSAREHLDQAIALYDALDSLPPVFRAAGDPGAACRAYAALTLWHLGYPQQALRRSQEAIALARKLAHPFTLAYILDFAALVHQFRGEPHAAQEMAEAAVAIAAEQRFAHWLNVGTIVHGAALAEQGQRAEGIALMRHGLAATGASGARSGWPYYHTLLAEFSLQDGNTEEGLASLGVGLALSQKNHEVWKEPESYRVKGELTLQKGVRGWGLGAGSLSPQAPSLKPQVPSGVAREAEECFLKAIDIARKQHAKSLELRAVMSLVRLRQQQATQHAARHTQHAARNVRDQAHSMLSEIYNWFTEGFDTADLREAKALLEALS